MECLFQVKKLIASLKTGDKYRNRYTEIENNTVKFVNDINVILASID